jgi:selenide,water dikinase
LAGGHSIDAPEPFFGLAVTGEVAVGNIKRNNTARPGDVLLLTKPLGVGILSTAHKRGKLREGHAHIARDLMCRPNSIGMALGEMPEVHAMTDVTGFGLLGHLIEMCEGSGLRADLSYSNVPLIKESMDYLAEGCYADGALRNWASYGHKVSGADGLERMMLLSDPQTSGGLLIACAPGAAKRVVSLVELSGGSPARIGTTSQGGATAIVTVV